MIRFRHKGDFRHAEVFFNKAKNRTAVVEILRRYGQKGVDALSADTPKDTGETASLWSYEVVRTGAGYSLFWNNASINDGVNIAVILQYGHGTGTGGYVRGVDYINPAIRPIFDQIAEEAWKEVAAT